MKLWWETSSCLFLPWRSSLWTHKALPLCSGGEREFSSCSCCLLAKSCLTLCDPMDYNLPGSSVHGILQARILEWVAIPFSRGSSHPKDWTWVSCTGRWILYHLSHLLCYNFNFHRFVVSIGKVFISCALLLHPASLINPLIAEKCQN